MGIIDRFVLFVYSLMIMIMSALALVVCTQLVSQGYLWEVFVAYIGGSAALAAAVAVVSSAVIAVLSLYLLRVSVRFAPVGEKKKEAVIVHGSIGEVQITVDAVKNLVDKRARSIKGVRDAKVQVAVRANADKEEIKIKVTLIIGQENHIPTVSDEVRGAIKESLTDVVGLEAFQVDIVVDDISNAPVQKQRVV